MSYRLLLESFNELFCAFQGLLLSREKHVLHPISVRRHFFAFLESADK